jgi:beta-lactamase regulating signal transducer with metallopeptidase domain
MSPALSLSPGASALSTIVAIGAGVTLLLIAAAFVAALPVVRSAAARHFVWKLALTGAVALTLAAPFMPVVPMPIAVPAPLAPISMAPFDAESPWPLPAATSVDTRAGTATRTNAVPVARPSRVSLGATAARLWLFGALGLAAWWTIGNLGLVRLVRRATPIADPAWVALLGREVERIGVVARVRLLRSPAVGSPLTWRARQVVVLLPDDAESWPAERRRVVLAHELAHAARGDHFAQLAASAACALHWYNPLVWMAARRLRAESERACDDRVLELGTAGADYAAHLLDVARGSRALQMGGQVAIGMARPSQLEGRLLAVLDPRRIRSAPAFRSRVLAWTGLAAVIVPLAAMRPVPSRAQLSRALLVEPSRSASGIARKTSSIAAPLRDRVAEPRSSGAFRSSVAVEDDSTFEQALDASPGGLLELDLETGATVRVRGWDQGKASLHATLAGEDWRGSRVTFEKTGRGLRLRTWQERSGGDVSTEHDFELQVPRKTNIRINSAGGALTLLDLDGDFSGTTGGGGLTFERVSGHASLSTGGGDIRVSDSQLSGRVGTGGGIVRIAGNRGDLRGSSGSGPVIYGDEEGAGRDVVTTRDRNGRTVTNYRDDSTSDKDFTYRKGSKTERARYEKEMEKEKAGGDVRYEKEKADKDTRYEKEKADKELKYERDSKVDKDFDYDRDAQLEERKRERAAREIEQASERVARKIEQQNERMAREIEQKTERAARETEQKTERAEREAEERAQRDERKEVESNERAERLEQEKAERRERTERAQVEKIERAERDKAELPDKMEMRGYAQSRMGGLRITKAGGDIVLDAAPDGATLSTGGGLIRVGRSSGTIRANTGGGAIELGPVAGSVRAGTGAGDVKITISSDGDPGHSVEVWTGHGSAVIELPADLSARFDLETAYTESMGRATRIVSDWPLERAEPTGPDDSEGTPRTYLRAAGTAGSGRGLIHIKVVNGDITIRRAPR